MWRFSIYLNTRYEAVGLNQAYVKRKKLAELEILLIQSHLRKCRATFFFLTLGDISVCMCEGFKRVRDGSVVLEVSSFDR